jgi:hypothetical protein
MFCVKFNAATIDSGPFAMLPRKILIAVAALAGLLLAAGAVVLLVGRQSSDQLTPTDPNFVWLETAMKQCDAEAGKAKDALYFLVTPLVDEPRDEAGWRRVSRNDIGNAILLNAEDTLAGLRRKALRLSTDRYTFSIRVEGTNEVLAWKPAVGVKQFVYESAAAIASFRVQFQPRQSGGASNWGATFTRVPGNCYWVNAILRH